MPVGIPPFEFVKLESGIFEVRENGVVIDQCKSKGQYIHSWNRKQRALLETKNSKLNDSDFVSTKTKTGKTVKVERGRMKEYTENLRVRAPIHAWVYNKETADLICEMISLGASMVEIGRQEGFPPPITIIGWRKNHKEFRDAFNEAIKQRAHSFRDKVLDIAENTNDSNKVAASKLKIDTLRWAAEKDNPTEFGPPTKNDQISTQPIQILIDTGIRREIVIESIQHEPNDLVIENKGISDGDNTQAVDGDNGNTTNIGRIWDPSTGS